MKVKKAAFVVPPLFLLPLFLVACRQTPNQGESSGSRMSESGVSFSEASESEESAHLPMNEAVAVADLKVTVTSAYSTNIFLNSEFGMEGQPLEEVTDGANLFINLEVTNDSGTDAELSQRFGIVNHPENGNTWAKITDMTDQANRDDPTYHLDKAFYQASWILEAGKTKAIQLFLELPSRVYPVYLGLFGLEGGEPIETVEIIPFEQWYVLSNEEAKELIEELFSGSRVAAKEIVGYQFEGEDEGGFYYPFEVTTDGKVAYYFVKRDTGAIYSGVFDERYADYPAVPGERID